MTTIHDAYINALLADATYALDGTATDGLTSSQLEEKLKERMTPALAEYIGDNFKVITHIETGDHGLGSGFDATAWRDKSDNKVYVSLQGTKGFSDWSEDYDIVNSGGAKRQIVSMVNWWMMHSTPANQAAMQIDYNIFTGSFYIAPSVEGTGLLDGASNVSVNGHSLGGHLAAAFTRLFGANNIVGHTYTYNSAGFTSSSESIFAEIEMLLYPNNSKGRFPTPFEQTNYFAEHGINVTTNTLFFEQTGFRLAVFNEEGAGFPNHYMYKLTDSLALANLLYSLDNSLDMTDVNTLFEMGASQPEASLEAILDAVRHLFLGGAIVATPIGDADESAETRKAYHENLKNLQDNNAFKDAIGKLNIVKTSVIAGHKYQDNELGLAYRYALLHLNPFVVTGFDYSDHNQNGELDLYDPITDEGALTDEYVKARAEMLKYKMVYDTEDMDYDDKYSPEGVQGDWDYIDETIGIELAIDGEEVTFFDYQIVFGSSDGEPLVGSGDSDKLFGMGGNDDIYGNGGDDYLEGNAGNDLMDGGDDNDTLLGGVGDDKMKGREGEDYLKGGAGKDILRGGTGRDLLVGGMGQDTLIGGDGIDILYGDHRFFDISTQQYLIQNDNAPDRLDGGAGDDQYYASTGDIINDADGKGWINLMVNFGQDVYGYVSLDVFQADYKTEFTKYTKGIFLNYSYNETSKKLTVSQDGHPDNWLVIENFTMGQFGIGVDHNNAEQFKDECYWLPFGAHGVPKLKEDCYLSYDPWWYEITGTDQPDVIYGTVGDDELIAAAGDDEVYAGPGDDIVYGGLGDDILYGEEGGDELYGGPGNDQLRGGPGDGDILDGGLGNDTYIFGIGDGDTTINNADNGVGRHDVLKFLSGINPSDVTISRSNYDLILNLQSSEESVTVTGYFWQEGAGGYALDAIQFADGTSWDVSAVLEMPLNGGDGDDTIYGDSGDDLINGHGGNDTLVGLEGNDTISGGDGDDQLFGFAGNDQINGDAGNDYIGGAEGADSLYGGIGDDTIFGGEGRDVIYGDAGNDYLDGGEAADSLYGGIGDDTIYGGDGDDSIRGMEGADTIYGGSGYNIIYGGGGDDQINGGSGDDEIRGGDGNDYLVGGSSYSLDPGSDDLLFGDAGDDVLVSGNGYSSGGDGNDTYIHNAGDGNLRIYNDDIGTNSNDVLIINGIESSIPNVERGQDDELIITYTIDNRDETITVTGYFDQEASTGQALDSITFSEDGVIWDIDHVKDAVKAERLILFGGPLGRWLEGMEGDDFIYGDEEKRNWLFGHGGNDYIEGGGDNDYLDGGNGDDHLFAGGDNDTLIGGNGNDYLAGGDGTDTLKGGSGDDVLYGGAGADDLLIGHDGADTYLYGPGDGNTRIIPDEHDTIRFLPGIAPEDIDVSFVGDDLHLIVNNDGSVIVFQAYFDSKIEADVANLGRVEFADGTVWDTQYIANILGQENDSNNRLFADESGSTLNGMGGDDWIIGNDGNDTLYGGEGSNRLWGGDGDDTLVNSCGISTGGGGSDTYIHVAGSGNLVIHNNDFGVPGKDLLIVQGVSHNDTQLSRGLENELELRYEANSRIEQITILHFFDKDEVTAEALDSIIFSDDGTTWDLDYIKMELLSVTLNAIPYGEELHGAGGNDFIYGAEGDDQLYGGGGHDTIDGAAGNDHLYGGYGDDNLSGGDGDDVLQGGYGNDELSGGSGDDELIGGTGVDILSGGDGADYMDGSTGDDQLLGDDGNDIMIGGEGNDYFLGGEGDDEISGGAGDDTLKGNGGNDVLDGGDGDDYISGGSGVDHLIGGKGNDALWSDGANSELFGGEGSDYLHTLGDDSLLYGGAGDDILHGDTGATLVGGKGNDLIKGGYRDSRYIFSYGDGQDVIQDVNTNRSNRGDTIEFIDVASSDITAKRSGESLILSNIYSGDQIIVEDQFHGRNDDSFIHRTISRVVFSDGVTWRYPDLILHLFEGAIEDQVATKDEDFSFYIINNALRGPNNYSYKDVPNLLEPTLEDGSPLPDWLSFDKYDGHFSGTPGADDVGELRIKVTGFYSSYGTASDIFVLNVSPPKEDINNAPVLDNPIVDRTATEGDLLSFRIPGDAFSDIDSNDTLTYSATLEDGSPLPGWLSFNHEYHAFSGTPEGGDVGELQIKVTATDQAGTSASDIFILDVAGVGGSHAPVPDNTMDDQNATEGDGFNFQVPSDTHSDVGVSDYDVTVQATDLADMSVLNSFHSSVGNVALSDPAGDMFTGNHIDDFIIGGDNSERIRGFQNNNQLLATGGNAKLVGGQAEGILYGGEGSDTHLLSKMDGKDIALDYVVDPDSLDSSNSSDVAHGDLSTTHHWNDRVIAVVGTYDNVAIENRYGSEGFQSEAIEADGLNLQNDQVNQLVNAMAQFDVPNGVGAVISQDESDKLEPVLAACWQ